MKKNVSKFKAIARQFLEAEWISTPILNGGKLECNIPHVANIEIYFDLDSANQIIPGTVIARVYSFGSNFDAKKCETLPAGLQFAQDFVLARIKYLSGLIPDGSTFGPGILTIKVPRIVECDLGDVKFIVKLDGSGSGVIETQPDLSKDDGSGNDVDDGYYTEDDISKLEYEAAIDVLESIILAQACSGMDISAPKYAESIQTVLDAILNNYD